MTNRVPAEVFPPGDTIKDELEERGWTQLDLAEIIGRDPNQVNLIINGKAGISPETAKRLGDAFGTSAEFWLNLESAYQLWLNHNKIGVDDSVARRAELYARFPVREMVKRHWVEATDNVDILKAQLLDFFGMKGLDDTRAFAHAARMSGSSSDGTRSPVQLAWLCRARQLARAAPVTRPFSQERLSEALDRLHLLKHSAEEIRHVPRILAEAGIHFLIIEHLPQSRIDGACFWLDARSPVVVLSLRIERIDCFWFTLMHELMHVKNKDGIDQPTVDTNLVGEQAQPTSEKTDSERRADEGAAEALIPSASLYSFIARVRPLYSKVRIRQFAALMHVHPGIVVGQLQHRGEIDWSHNREMLAKIRSLITSAALTDGWGTALPAGL